jgi:DNA-binding transcriptional MerR regulator
MKKKGTEVFYSIGEVADKIGRSSQTIKNWYEWQATVPDEERKLPEVHTNLDARGTRYFKEADIEQLITFRDNIQYGQLAEVSQLKWGKRGPAAAEAADNA